MDGAFGILSHSDSGLIEVADLVLGLRVSMSRGFLVPISGHFGILRHTGSGEVVRCESDLIANRSLLGEFANAVQICRHTGLSVDGHGGP